MEARTIRVKVTYEAKTNVFKTRLDRPVQPFGPLTGKLSSLVGLDELFYC